MKQIIKLGCYVAIYKFRKAFGVNWDVEQILIAVGVFGIVIPLYLLAMYLNYSQIDFSDLSSLSH